MKLVERFLAELARAWDREERPRLQVLGSTALMLRTDFVRATKDSDVLRTLDLHEAVSERLLVGRTLQKWRVAVPIVAWSERRCARAYPHDGPSIVAMTRAERLVNLSSSGSSREDRGIGRAGAASSDE
ncbi:MAG: hypothetical protein KF901_19500 [Myxococcales bacterium]|nr:hypothetical protein [Myxococcales bacterium]